MNRSPESSRVAAAIAEVDAALRFRLQRENGPALYRPGFSAASDDCLANLDVTAALRHQFEVCRSHAEALLVQDRLGELLLGIEERESLIRRALGFLPPTEEAKLAELTAGSELQPAAAASSVKVLMATVAAVTEAASKATALTYGMLVLAGIRSRDQLLANARRVDLLFDRVTSAPSVIQALEAASGTFSGAARTISPDAGFQNQFSVLLSVHEQLWQLKPERVSTPFLLPQVVEAYLGAGRGVGNSLGLAVVDAIVVSKLGFPVRFHLDAGVVSLEVLVENRSVYWDTVHRHPLSFVPVGSTHRLSDAGLFALAYSSLGAEFFNRGQFDRAVEAYERSVELAPENAATYNSLALCYIRRQMPEKAVSWVEHAIGLALDTPEAYFNLGNAYSMMQRWSSAVEAFRKAIAMRPGYVEAYNNLGLVLHRSGSSGDAVAMLRKAIELEPSYAQAYFNLGTIYMEKARYDEAVANYHEATRLQPDFVQAYYNMGQAEYCRGRLNAAINCYRKAVQINPKHYGAWHNLGIAYRDKGLTDKAVEALEKAVALNPNLMR